MCTVCQNVTEVAAAKLLCAVERRAAATTALQMQNSPDCGDRLM
jgi:hypothetical protein